MDVDRWITRLDLFLQNHTENGTIWWALTHSPTNTREHVPSGQVPAWSALFNYALELALDDSAPDLRRLFVQVLPSLMLGYARDLNPPAQLEMLLEGDFEALWSALSATRPGPDAASSGTRTPRSSFSCRRVLHKAKHRRLSQAAQHILSTPLAPRTPQTWKALEDLFPDVPDTVLHPQLEECLSARLTDPAPLQSPRWNARTASDESLLALLQRLPAGISPGPSGLRVEHLQALEQHVRPALVR
ncbi:MAG: hypothetical protein AAFY26_27370, partial [Cyanobacteria bacterium J06638_22]